jgi:hypothetical protein
MNKLPELVDKYNNLLTDYKSYNMSSKTKKEEPINATNNIYDIGNKISEILYQDAIKKIDSDVIYIKYILGVNDIKNNIAHNNIEKALKINNNFVYVCFKQCLSSLENEPDSLECYRCLFNSYVIPHNGIWQSFSVLCKLIFVITEQLNNISIEYKLQLIQEIVTILPYKYSENNKDYSNKITGNGTNSFINDIFSKQDMLRIAHLKDVKRYENLKDELESLHNNINDIVNKFKRFHNIPKSILEFGRIMFELNTKEEINFGELTNLSKEMIELINESRIDARDRKSVV